MGKNKKDVHFLIDENGLYMQILKRVKDSNKYHSLSRAIKHCIINIISTGSKKFVLVDDANSKCFLTDSEFVDVLELPQNDIEGVGNEKND